MKEPTPSPGMPQPGKDLGGKAVFDKPRGLTALARLVTDYYGFLDDYAEAKRPPYFFLAIWVAGISLDIYKLEYRTFLFGGYDITYWLGVFIAVLVFGIAFGPLAYFILGGLFHVRVLMCGGRRRFKISRLIWLYSSLPIFVWTILVFMVDTLIFDDAYFTGQASFAFDFSAGIGFVVCMAYSTHLSYKGVVGAQAGGKVRAFILFVILPAIFYIGSLSGGFWLGQSSVSGAVSLGHDGLQQYYEGDLDAAERTIRQAIDMTDVDQTDDLRTMLINLGYVYGAKDDTPAAVQCYQRAMAITGIDHPKYHYLKGELALMDGEAFEAIGWFQQTLDHDPEDHQAHNQLSLIYGGDVDASIEDFQLALSHSQRAFQLSQDLAGRQNLAVSLYFVNEFESARDHLRFITRKYPDNAYAKFYLGLTEYQLGNIEAAQGQLRKAVALDSSHYVDYVAEILAGQEP